MLRGLQRCSLPILIKPKLHWKKAKDNLDQEFLDFEQHQSQHSRSELDTLKAKWLNHIIDSFLLKLNTFFLLSPLYLYNKTWNMDGAMLGFKSWQVCWLSINQHLALRCQDISPPDHIRSQPPANSAVWQTGAGPPPPPSCCLAVCLPAWCIQTGPQTRTGESLPLDRTLLVHGGR